MCKFTTSVRCNSAGSSGRVVLILVSLVTSGRLLATSTSSLKALSSSIWNEEYLSEQPSIYVTDQADNCAFVGTDPIKGHQQNRNWTQHCHSSPKVNPVTISNTIVERKQAVELSSAQPKNFSTTTSMEWTAAQKCRWEVYEYWNPINDHFLSLGQSNPPMIDWMWDMGDYFVLNLKWDTMQSWKEQMLTNATWIWKDQWGNEFLATFSLHGSKLFTLMSNSTKSNASPRSIPQSFWYSNYTLPANRTILPWIYDLRLFTKCDAVEMAEEEQPPPDTKIGLCSKFAGDRDKVAPFVAYHRMIGVQHFWFYVNEPKFDLSDLPQSPEITYVPYPFTMVGKPKIEGRHLPRRRGHCFQQEAQQQCLYRAKKYGLDWIMTQDVDEYLWVGTIEESDQFRNWTHNSSSSHSSSVLATFLKPYEKNGVLGSIRVEGWAFGSRKATVLPLDMVTRAASPSGGKDKHIYNVRMATNIGVHWLFEGGFAYRGLPPTAIRWNHYRRTMGKRFIYKLRDSKNQTLVQDTALRDKYRQGVVEWITAHPTPLQQRHLQEQGGQGNAGSAAKMS